MNWNPKNWGKVQFIPVPPPPIPKLMPSAPKQIRCPNCNAPLRPNQRQCEYCGSWFDVPDTAQIVFYADNEPIMIAEGIQNELNRQR